MALMLGLCLALYGVINKIYSVDQSAILMKPQVNKLQNDVGWVSLALKQQLYRVSFYFWWVILSMMEGGPFRIHYLALWHLKHSAVYPPRDVSSCNCLYLSISFLSFLFLQNKSLALWF